MTVSNDKISQVLIGTVKLDWIQYQKIPYDGLKHALLKGKHIIMPAPSTKHQDRLVEVLTTLRTFVSKQKLGRVLTSPIDVKFSEEDGFQPDILFLKNSDLNKDTGIIIDGVPTLIIEILSPDSEDADYGWKKNMSEQYHVPEYWVIDFRYKLVEVFHLYKNRYTSTVFKEGESVQSSLLELKDFKIPVHSLFPD